MRRFLGVGILLFVSFAGWQIGGILSTDALGMALGVLFGMMAGIPAALIALAASRMTEPQPRPTESIHLPALLAPHQSTVTPQSVIVLPGKRQERIERGA